MQTEDALVRRKNTFSLLLIETMSVELSVRDKSILEHYFFRSHVH